MRFGNIILFAALALPIAATAQEDEQIPAKQLHDRHCLACHTTGIYTRPTRFIDSRDALHAQVTRCAREAAKVDWNQAQIDAVTGYLNNRFYGF